MENQFIVEISARVSICMSKMMFAFVFRAIARRTSLLFCYRMVADFLPRVPLALLCHCRFELPYTTPCLVGHEMSQRRHGIPIMRRRVRTNLEFRCSHVRHSHDECLPSKRTSDSYLKCTTATPATMTMKARAFKS